MYGSDKDASDTKIFGFWVYLMTDLVIFAVLFACFHCSARKYFRTARPQRAVSFPSVLAETLILLTSSFTCSLAMIAVHRRQKNGPSIWFIITFLLGAAFLFIEISEFTDFVERGASWQTKRFSLLIFHLGGHAWLSHLCWAFVDGGDDVSHCFTPPYGTQYFKDFSHGSFLALFGFCLDFYFYCCLRNWVFTIGIAMIKEMSLRGYRFYRFFASINICTAYFIIIDPQTFGFNVGTAVW